jgi:hypothetical protein
MNCSTCKWFNQPRKDLTGILCTVGADSNHIEIPMDQVGVCIRRSPDHNGFPQVLTVNTACGDYENG